jgi:hypothetical protein
VTLGYTPTTFTEVTANDGSTSTTSTITLSGDTFTIPAGNFTSGVHYNVTNLPAGMTMVITSTGVTGAVVSITGNATAHANAQDVANLTITWLDAAFTNALAVNVTDSTKNNFSIDFTDPASIGWAGTFTEAVANNGSVSGSLVGTLTGDTFIGAVANGAAFTGGGVHYTASNVPAGLSVTVTKTSGTVATVTLSGNATSHANANNIANLTITFQNGVFTTTPVAANVTNSSYATGVVNFVDQASILYAGSFAEHVSGNGTLTGSRTATITGDTFINASGTLTENTHFTLTNKPAGSHCSDEC